MLVVSRWVLRALLVLNILAGVSLLLLLGWSFLDQSRFLSAALRVSPAVDEAMFLAGFRIAFSAILPATIAAHLLFTRLLAILRSVAQGQPFASANGRRLQVSAWSLLVIQLCDLLFGYGATTADLAAGERVSGWSPSLAGWIAVLLVFVLAGVFSEGSRLRAEAELTI
jgi:hypothetical protein